MHIRWRLFGLSLGGLMLVGGAGVVAVESILDGWNRASRERELFVRAQLLAQDLSDIPAAPNERFEAKIRALGEVARARITVIAEDGQVIADSRLEYPAMLRMDNHANRPEIRHARAEGSGVSRRRSATLRMGMLYTATLLSSAPHAPVLRVSIPLSLEESARWRLRKLFFAVALVGLLVAFLLSTVANRLLSRTLLEIMARVPGAEVPRGGADGFGALQGSFNRLSERLEESVSSLAKERGRLAAVLESMDDAVMVVAGDQTLTIVNPACEALLGVSSEVLGRPLSELKAAPQLTPLVARGCEAPAKEELSLPEGRQLVARASPNVETGGAVVVLHEVTEVRRLETIRRDFVANVSHELRTPVAVIRANAETLLDGALDNPKHARTFVEATYRNAERLARIISDLLDLSRIEAGRYKLSVRAVSAAQLFSSTVSRLTDKAEARGMRLTVAELPEDLLLRADPKALEQVLGNLVENAIKYNPEGAEVVLRAARTDADTARVEVKDNGAGIGAEHRARIFERFYRVDKGRSRERGGTGLGLAIVKHLVEAMGGAVGVEPVAPSGSCFWFSLPLSRREALLEDED